MLRCPPSCINLMPEDISTFEQRLAARNSIPSDRSGPSSIRLALGPGRLTRHAVVPAEANVGRRLAASNASEATLHESEKSDNTRDNTADVRSAQADQSGFCNEAAKALESVMLKHQSTSQASPRRHVESFYAVGSNDSPSPQQSQDVISPIDGAHDRPTHGSSSVPSRSFPTSSRGTTVLGEIHHDAYPSKPRPEVRLIPGARERRRNLRSHDWHLHEDRTEQRDATESSHMPRTTVGRTPVERPVPELVVSTDSTTNVSLDPGAPVFMPRTRFGTDFSTDGGNPLSLRSGWSSLNNSENPTDLRIRPSSEQNAILPTRRRGGVSTDSGIALVDDVLDRRNGEVQPTSRRMSRTSDQNTAIGRQERIVERYPLLRPQRRPSRVPQRSAPNARRTYSRSPSGTSRRSHTTAEPTRRQTLIPGGWNTAPQARSIVPSLSMDIQSTPNLLFAPHSIPRIHARGSSLSWSRRSSRSSIFQRVISMTSGDSAGHERLRTQLPSEESSNAAAEAIGLRNSPLDELMERLTRLSVDRPRSVGRSWERAPAGVSRASLLNGDLFRQEDIPQPPKVITAGDRIDSPQLTACNEIDSAVEDPVALSLALPPSSPATNSSASAIHSTPPTCKDASIPTPSHASQSGGRATQSVESIIKRKPVSSATTTPKVKVYDDGKPHDTQPKTPADLNRTGRRMANRSDSAVQRSPARLGHTIVSSPPQIPDRRPHRKTYVAGHSSGQEGASGATSRPAAPFPTPGPAAHPASARATRSTQGENDEDVHLHGLEHDQLVFQVRCCQDGSLEITPPKEGRFERFLS